jgi:3-oxoacyl-[acyl-carrier protein] reductase
VDLKLKNKNALVLASSAGIGKAIAAGLYQEGVNVCMASRSDEKLRATHTEIFDKKNHSKLVFKTCDLGKKSDVENIVKFAQAELGSIDILINNQGGPTPGSFSSITEEQVLEAINANLLSVLRATRLCLPEMERKGWGRIINILSISAKEPIPNLFLSNLIRPAILGMAKTIAQEKARAGVTINSLLPSAVLTDRSRLFVETKAKTENKPFDEVLKEVAANIPAGYLASPEEVAAAALFLCGESSTYINGAAIALDGASSKSLF